jgi:hypothetical protein
MIKTGQSKIFKINDYEWWVAHDAESLLTYLRANGYDVESNYGDPLELPFLELSDAEMKRLVFVEDDGTKVSFQEEFESREWNNAPTFFASIEY